MSEAVINRIDIAPLLPAIECGALILVPNHRIRDAILASHAQTRADGVFRTPRVIAIDIWIREYWDLCAHNGIAPFAELRLLDPAQEAILWTTVIEESLGDLPLLNPEDTAVGASQSYRDLKLWLPDDSLAALRNHSSNPDIAAFLQWIRSYRARCDALQAISLVDAIENLLRTGLQAARAQLPLPTNICLANFFESPPLYERLFMAMGELSNLESVALIGHDAPAVQARHTFSDQNAELIACARWANSLRRQQPASHIGIICSEDLLGQPALRQLVETALADDPLSAALTGQALYNSTGSRLSLLEAPLLHDAFLLLNLGREQQASSDLCRLLQSPYLLAADSEREARLQMELHMRRYFAAHATMTDFCWHLAQSDRPTYSPQLAAALLAYRTRLRRYSATATARQWSERFAELLADCGWGVSCYSDTEANLLALWRDALTALADSSTLLGPLTQTAALSRLKLLCQQQRQPQHFDARQPLSIYTVAEAIGLRFDHVWLLGFSDQHWPSPARPSPFIPYALQREARLPGCHSDLHFELATRQFQLLHGAVSQTLIASYHRTDGELQLSPSSFITALPLETATDPDSSAAQFLRTAGAAVPAFTTADDLASFPLQEAEAVRGGQSIISNQSSCPFRAFARHRLEAEPLAPFTPGLSPMARGSAVHAALETLFAAVTDSATLHTLDAASRAAHVATAANQAIDYLARRYRDLMTPRFKAIEHARVSALLDRFLDLEAGREHFQVIAREQDNEWRHERLTLRLKIDRIDRLADNSLALIDYKTGKRGARTQRLTDVRPEDMQLPLYYTVATAQQPDPVSSVMIASVNAENIGYSGLAAAANFHRKIKPVAEDNRIRREWNNLTHQWQLTVTELAQEFVAGRADVAPVNGRKTCLYCRMESLCRIRELDQAEAEENDEESPP